jgi:hypothetical protein
MSVKQADQSAAQAARWELGIASPSDEEKVGRHHAFTLDLNLTAALECVFRLQPSIRVFGHLDARRQAT